jgi:hypothetical protein
MSISRLMQMAAAGAGGEYQISRSLRFNSADSAYLSRTPASASNRKTWTWSGWVKFGSLSETFPRLFSTGTDANNRTEILFISSTNQIRFLSNVSGVSRGLIDTVSVLRDPSAWYHLVISLNASATTLSVYINGVQQTLTTTDAIANVDHMVNATNAHNIGRYFGSGNHFSGYLTEINFIDGQALTPSSFGETNETTGVWSPIAYAGSYGTNGFYLNFSDNSDVTAATLGADYSGNGNNWTPSGFSVTAGAGNDSLVDVPTRNTEDVDTGAGGEVRGNYATWNPLDQVQSSTFSNGNLDVVTGTTTVFGARGTIAVSSGQWYWEVTPTAGVATADCIIGIDSAITPINSSTAQKNVGATATSYGYRASGEKITSSSSTAYGNSYTNNDVIGVALNLDAGEIKFYKNGVVQNSGTAAFTGLSGSFYPAFSDGDPSNALTVTANFGQRPFAYTAPSGFKALVTTNLPEPTVVQGDDYFNTVLFTGNHPTGQSITGVGFAPDLTWFKSRTVISSHNLVDKVRGAFRLRSDTTDAETSATVTLDSDGFTVGAQSESNDGSMVAWNWKANGAGVSNTAGTITGTVTVSANTIAGISIVTYTGNGVNATVGHGLGVAPKMVIVKRRNGSVENWMVYHASNTTPNANAGNNRLLLNLTNASNSDSAIWNDTNPTFSVFSVGTSSEVNGNTATYVAYCFAEVEGFSKFSSYTGNGLADGPFVYTGFRPAFLMVKRSSSGAGTANWVVLDTSRDIYNLAGQALMPNLADVEYTPASSGYPMDILSNGFKQRGASVSQNESTSTYIYMAFAENPFKYSLAR